jgi:hypothetical protein
MDCYRQRLQCISDTGAGDAFTGIDHEQRIVSGTLNKGFIQVEKLVFLPFETGAGMRALVVIGKKLAVFMHDKNGLGFAFDFNLETFAARVFDISGFAENVSHNV